MLVLCADFSIFTNDTRFLSSNVQLIKSLHLEVLGIYSIIILHNINKTALIRLFSLVALINER